MRTGFALIDVSLVVLLAAPPLLLLVLGVPALAGRRLPESTVGHATRFAMLAMFAASVVALATYVASGDGPRTVSYGTLYVSATGGFVLDFLVDGFSLMFVALCAGMCGVAAAFSSRYLHREPGHNRYFVLFAGFVWGITLVALAGTVEVLFVGWELLGLSSALLVGFFHERRAPVANALRVFAVYRLSDVAMMSAAVVIHHSAGRGSLSVLFSGSVPSSSALGDAPVPWIALLLIAAAAGKSALFPLSGWLPRAMEGPTPSSAIYYGALSIHAGCFLLLRAQPLLAQSTAGPILLGLAGIATVLHATFAARAQADVKSALAYACLTQVGIIVCEISLGWTTLAFVHLVCHASFRFLQFLSAPNLLHDLHELENALGGHEGGLRSPAVAGAGPGRLERSAYLVALERGFLDSLVEGAVVTPFQKVAAGLDNLDRRLCGNAGGKPRGADD